MTGTERKALNKYYPPDFDPRKIPKVRGERNKQYVIRVMAPFNMKCSTCGEYIYKGKKFNARRETVEDDDYLGLFLFRFYIRCPRCLAEITFKTDLKNCDYAAEHGSTRLFEADRALQEKAKEKERQEEEDKQNAMKQLEKRTKMSRFEMEAIERLEELREIKHREGKLDYDNIISEVTKQQREELLRQEREDDEFVKRLFAKDVTGAKRLKKEQSDEDDEGEEMTSGTSSSVRRALGGDLVCSEDKTTQSSQKTSEDKNAQSSQKTKSDWNQRKLLMGAVTRKAKHVQLTAKKLEKNSGECSSATTATGPSASTSLALLSGYSSDSDDSD